jgi:YcaO-like protein with predicted kinase domain
MSCLRPLLVEWPRSERGLPIVDPGVNTSSAPGPRQSPMMPLQGTGRPFLGTADGLRAMAPHGATPGDEIHKSYRHGTHRTVAPTETLARVGPLMAQMGITRIANITGLDRIGVPVVMVCRPNSRSIAVSQGKGLDLAAAKASGLMEAVETYHAETVTSFLKLGSYRELGRTHPLVDVAALPRAKGSPYHDDEPLLWIEGRDLISRSSVWVPYELVHTDYTLPRGPAHGCFVANTNGLASGNHILEAVSHGIHEVIERDATALWKHTRRRSRRALELETVDDDACRWVLDRFAQADIAVKVWDTTSDVGIASFNCLVLGRDDDSADPEFGAGCHPVRSIALLRALTEAAQARTTYIAGSRDDFRAADYTPAQRARRLRDCHTLMNGDTPARDFHDVPTHDRDSLDEDVSWALECLLAVGIRQVVAVDLTKPELGLPVARVVIPGLEGPDEGEGDRHVPGPRARAVEERTA